MRKSRAALDSLTRLVVLVLVLAFSRPVRADMRDNPQEARVPMPRRAATATPPNWEQRTHDVGSIWLGTESGPGFVYRGLDCLGREQPGTRYPAGTLQAFGGGYLWVAGVTHGDTLVSANEFLPDPWPGGGLELRTTREHYESGPYCRGADYSASALSELDIVAVTPDTVTDPVYNPPNSYETRPHIPLGIAVTTTTLGWSYEYARNFVLVEFTVRNIPYYPHGQYINDQKITGMYIGFFLSGGTRLSPDPSGRNFAGLPDDFMGIQYTAPTPGGGGLEDSIMLMWSADDDGDPDRDRHTYGRESVPAALGMRIVNPIRPGLKYSYNWWVAGLPDNQYGHWGPVRRSVPPELVYLTIDWPSTDRMMYAALSNGEVDYPFIEAAKNHEYEGWLPPHKDAAELARGWYHLDQLVSVGPFELELFDSVTFAIAIVGCEEFHTDPANYAKFFNPNDQTHYLEGLNFKELGKNAQWAGWVYDTPGFDTDGDGYAGPYHIVGNDTDFYRGDGVPDYRGPSPPTPPIIRPTTAEGKVTLRWNGSRAEHEVDLFSKRVDFEGYRVFMSRTGRTSDWALLAGRDLINYARLTWNRNRRRWERLDPPFTLDSLKRLYDSLSLKQFGYPFHPDSFRSGDPDRALLEVLWDPEDPVRIDSLYLRFEPFEDNAMVDDRLYCNLAQGGREIVGVIRKLFPDAPPDSLAVRADGSEFYPYYEYEYAIKGLQSAEPLFFSVATFDNGEGDINLGPLQSDPTVNDVEVWPINSVEIVKTEHPRPGVYPNPYRISDDYNGAGWENPRGLEPDRERARKVTFYNVPDTCTVSIWSLDGDLIRRLDHNSDPTNSEASVVVWNLITRNTQAIKTGIYLYSIESRFGTDVGKLVIIK